MSDSYECGLCGARGAEKMGICGPCKKKMLEDDIIIETFEKEEEEACQD